MGADVEAAARRVSVSSLRRGLPSGTLGLRLPLRRHGLRLDVEAIELYDQASGVEVSRLNIFCGPKVTIHFTIDRLSSLDKSFFILQLQALHDSSVLNVECIS